MNSFCLVPNCSLEEVVNEVCLNDGIDLHGAVDLLLTDPPYTARSTQYRSKSEYDSPTTNDVVSVV